MASAQLLHRSSASAQPMMSRELLDAQVNMERVNHSVQHKSHVPKVMIMCTTGIVVEKGAGLPLAHCADLPGPDRRREQQGPAW